MTHQILADLHTHTVASQHAFSTVKENAESAKSNGLTCIAVSDHYYQYDDKIMLLNELSRMSGLRKSRPVKGMHIIAGGEFNLNQRLHEMVDVARIESAVPWRLIGAHGWFLDIPHFPIDSVPELYIQHIMQPAYITPTTFAHIERGITAFKNGNDQSAVREVLSQLVDLAVAHEIFLEINETSLRYSKENVELMKFWVAYARDHKALFCVGSDAHSCEDVGAFTEAIPFMEHMNLDNSYILNYDPIGLRDMAENVAKSTSVFM